MKRGGVIIGSAVAAGALCVVARTRQLHWGASPDEVTAGLPGDEFIGRPDLVATRAITIEARASDVWPWIAQIGQGRGGFYSYDVLENIAGCDVRSANHVVADWQTIDVGDELRLHPEVGLSVVRVDPGRALVARGGVPVGRTAPPFDFTWAFVVVDADEGTTRLIVRERFRYTRPWACLVVEPVEAASFVMTKKMLRGIRQRVERANA